MSNRKKGKTSECGEGQERSTKCRTLNLYFSNVCGKKDDHEVTSSQLPHSQLTPNIEEGGACDILDDNAEEDLVDTQGSKNVIIDNRHG